MYLKYYPILLVYGKTISNDEPIIEDTIQELFLGLWERRDNLFIKSTLETYLFVAFRNNLIRKLKANPKRDLKIELIDIEQPEAIHQKEQQLKTLLNKLPPRQKEVVFLRYYKNKSYREIAEILNISYQVARNFSYRAIRYLKKNFKHIHSIVLSIII